MKSYPDIRSLLKGKANHRRSLAALPFEKKIEIVFKLNERQRLIAGARASAQSKAKRKR